MSDIPRQTRSEFTGAAVQIVIASAVGLMFAAGTAVIGTIGIYMLPMAKEFGWGRGRISAAAMTVSWVTALCSPFVGRLLDRWGVRRVVLPSFVLYALSIMLLSQASSNPFWFYLPYVLVGIVAAACSAVPYTMTVTSWFNRRRGLALALFGILTTIGGSQVPIVARRLIAAFGWRGAYIGMGALILVIGLPVLALMLREPGSGSVRPATVVKGEQKATFGMEAREVRRTAAYWLLAAVQSLTIFATGGIMGHLVPMMVDRGETAAGGAHALALGVLGGMAGRILMGLLLDKFESPRIPFPFVLGALAGVLLLIHAQNRTHFVIAAMLISACTGAESEVAPYLHSRYFGLRAFAETFGLQFLFLAFANGLGITAMGAVFDVTHSYKLLLWVDVAIYAVIAVIFLILGPYRYPAHGTSSRVDERQEPLPHTANAIFSAAE